MTTMPIHYFIERILTYGRMIKFSHTVFALPFALSAVVLAWREYPITIIDIFWILLAMIGARSAAMGFNRIVDAGFDSKNPRTRDREIPSGRLSPLSATLFVVFFSLLFIFSAAMLGNLCFYFSLPVLALLFFYSYTKRLTVFCHVYLGFAISLAPIGAWVALTNTFSVSILVLSLALMTHIAGFDILYACQDTGFDKNEGLYSIPARWGVKKSLFISSILHVVSFCFFVSIYFIFNMGFIYLVTVAIIGFLLVLEHLIVNRNDLSKIDIAFFHINSIVSVILFIGILSDELARQWC